MKSQIYFVIILITWHFTLTAQVLARWDTILYSGGNQAEILELDSSYVTMVRGVNTSELQIWEVDFSGNVVDSNIVDLGAVIQNCGECLVSNNTKSMYYAHTLYYSLQDAQVQFLELNTNLDTIKSRYYNYDDTLTTEIFELQLIDDLLYFTGYVYIDPNQYHLLLGCMDTSFNLIWERKFIRNPLSGGYWGYDLEKTIDGGILISGISTNFPLGTFRKGFLLKTDSIGNEQWRLTLNYPNGVLGNQLHIEQRSDGNMIYCGAQNLSNGLQQLRFGVITDSGQVLVDTLIGKAVDIFGSASLVKTLDSNFVIAGSTYHKRAQGMAYKFDENGQSLWQRYYHYGELGETSEIYTVRATSDTGVIFAGTYYDQINNPSPTKVIYHWIKKVDKHGCQTPNCHNIYIPEIPFEEFSVELYPNPTSGKVHIRSDRCAPKTITAYTTIGSILVEPTQGSSIQIPSEYKGIVVIEIQCEEFTARGVVIKNR